jgi:hypothetical protein
MAMQTIADAMGARIKLIQYRKLVVSNTDGPRTSYQRVPIIQKARPIRGRRTRSYIFMETLQREG